MINLARLVLKKVVYFKSAKLDINPGVYFVRGRNLDSDLAHPTSNGAGKTLLFSTIPNVFYFSPPTASRKNSKKDLLKQGSSITVEFSTDTASYSVEQRSGKYVIQENSEDLKFSRVPDAEKYIRKIFPLSEIDYYSYCYVSTQRPYLLQSDTDLNRLEHITSIFRLDSYDVMSSFFSKRLAEMKDASIQLKVLNQKVLEATLSLDKISIPEGSESKADLKGLATKLEGLNEKKYQYTALLESADKLIKASEEVATLKEKFVTLFGFKPKKLEEVEASIKADLIAIRSIEDYQESLADFKEKVSTIKARLKELYSGDVEILNDEHRTLIEKLEVLQEKIAFLKSQASTEADLTRSLQAIYDNEHYDPSVTSVEDLSSSIEECRSTLKLKTLLEHGECTCPVCYQEVELDSIRSAVKMADKKLKKLLTLKKAQDLKVKEIELTSKLAKVEGASDKYADLKSKESNMKAKLEKVVSSLSEVKERKYLEGKLASLEKPVEPEEKATLNLSSKKLQAGLDLCKDLKSALKVQESLSSVEVEGIEDLNDKLKAVESRIKKVRSAIEEETDRIDSTRRLITEKELLEVSKASLLAEIAPLEDLVKDRTLYEALLKAYSRKGLKSLIAASICSVIEQNLNTYCGLCFAEPFSFSIDVSETGVSIKVDRGNGVVSDVRMLSGAESNSFRMLLVLVLLTIVPDERRTNVLILDEPCSHSDTVTRDIFLTRFLPAIQTIVPSIYIITPNVSDYIEGSSEILVQKKKGKSTIKLLED